jgi:hypothetical protein
VALVSPTWLTLEESQASTLEALCEAIVPGSSRVRPAVYADAVLARMDEGGRAATIAAIESLADAAGDADALADRAQTPEFLMIRALAIECFYSDFVAPDAKGPGAWEEIDFRFPLASQVKHDWSYLGVPG